MQGTVPTTPHSVSFCNALNRKTSSRNATVLRHEAHFICTFSHYHWSTTNATSMRTNRGQQQTLTSNTSQHHQAWLTRPSRQQWQPQRRATISPRLLHSQSL